MSGKDNDQAKVEVKIGDISFSAEGNKEWLGEQLEKIIESAGQLKTQTTDISNKTPEKVPEGGDESFSKSLATYIKEKNGDTNQNQRFLATAAWLHLKGHKPLTTALVTKALRDNHQKRLANPSDALNQNVRKGFCEKTSDGFFILPEGWEKALT